MESPKGTALSLLASLQGIDRLQREKKETLRMLEADIDRLQVQLVQQRAETAAKQAERDALETRRREIERLLEDEELKLKDRRMRLNRVRNEKELQALRREIEQGKESNQRNEEELLRVMEAAEAAEVAAAESERLLAGLEASSASQISDGHAQITEIAASVKREREQRMQVAASLDAALLRKYEQIFDRRGGTAVVEVRSGTCQGGHMNLPPQLYNELQRSSDIRLCPNCHRILFWRGESVDDGDRAT